MVTSRGTVIVSGLLNSKVDYLAQVLAGVTSLTRSGVNVVVSFQGVAGNNYRLERKLQLTDPTWQSIPGLTDLSVSSSGVAQITDPGAINLGHAFYRVRLLP